MSRRTAKQSPASAKKPSRSIDVAAPEPALTAQEERFVNEYLRDFNARAAAIRAGVARLNSRAWAKRALGEQRVNLEINRRIDEAKLEDLITPNRIVANLAAVANSAYDSGRVAALRELAAIFKLKPENGKVKNPNGKNGVGGVIRVPAMLDVDEWERLASDQQTRLKVLVRE